MRHDNSAHYNRETYLVYSREKLEVGEIGVSHLHVYSHT